MSSPSCIEANAILKDMHEKKQSLIRIATEVGSMASELREVRSRFSAQESTLEQETAGRQIAEAKGRALEKELNVLRKKLEEKRSFAISTSGIAEKYLTELVNLRTKLELVQQSAEASSTSAVTTQLQCEFLLKDIEYKNQLLEKQKNDALVLENQVTDLETELALKKTSENHLHKEMEMLQKEIKGQTAKAKDTDMKKIMESLEKCLSAKDEEVACLHDEIKCITNKINHKNRELDMEIERHQSSNEDLKKRIVQLEFWLQEAHTNLRKLHNAAEKQEKDLAELQAQGSLTISHSKGMQEFWKGSTLRKFLTLAAVALLFVARR